LKSGRLNLLENSGHVQACNGIALVTITTIMKSKIINIRTQNTGGVQENTSKILIGKSEGGKLTSLFCSRYLNNYDIDLQDKDIGRQNVLSSVIDQCLNRVQTASFESENREFVFL
jgi:hypothetical protein